MCFTDFLFVIILGSLCLGGIFVVYFREGLTILARLALNQKFKASASPVLRLSAWATELRHGSVHAWQVCR